MPKKRSATRDNPARSRERAVPARTRAPAATAVAAPAGGPAARRRRLASVSSTSPGAVPARPSDTAPAGSVACFVTPVVKSEYGRPSRSAIRREIASISRSSASSTTSSRPAARATISTVRSSCVGPRPPGHEAEVGRHPVAQRPLEVLRAVADDRDPLGVEPESLRLCGEERAVPVLPLAAHELAPRDDDRRPRPRAGGRQEERTIRRAVTTNTVPAGSSTRLPFRRTTTLSGFSSASWRRRPSNGFPWPRSSVPLYSSRPATEPDAHLHPRVALDGAHDELQPTPTAAVRLLRRLPVRGQAGHFLVLRPAEAPSGDHERGDDGDGEERDDRDAGFAGRAAIPALDRNATRADDRLVLADGEARVVLVDERLPVEAERVGVRAQEAPDVGGRREDVEALVLERPEVLRPDLRPLFEFREVELLAEAGLTKAGADVEHARGSVDASPRGSNRPRPVRAPLTPGLRSTRGSRRPRARRGRRARCRRPRSRGAGRHLRAGSRPRRRA